MKKRIYQVLFTISIILAITFVTIVFIDYLNYDFITNSAPFSALILFRSVEFLLPSIIAFVIGIILRRNI